MSDELPRSPDEVRDTFERIASDFDRTRTTPWPAVTRFVDSLGPVDIAVDLGCGNGRHLPLLTATSETVIGVDVSRAMLRTARRRAEAGIVDLLEATAPTLPIRDATVDAVLYIATMHHLPSPAARTASLDELARILRPEGTALVSVWAVTHERFDAETGFDTVVDWTLPDGTTAPRFYHIYDEAEFEGDLAAARVRVVDRWEESGNLYARVAPLGE